MEKIFLSVEEVLEDGSFLSWYFRDSREDVLAWEQWLSAHPEQKALVEEAVKKMSQLHIQEENISAKRIDLATERFSTALDQLKEGTATVVQMKTSRRRWWMIAAAAVFIGFVGLAVWKFSGGDKETFATDYGQLSKHILPDGSEVMLNANSTVKLGKNWENGGDREVWLKGEAFFNVKKTSSLERFIVHADQMDVIVTGTQFNIITRDDKNSVLLTEGSVTIRTMDGKEIKMMPGDFVEIRSDKLEKKTANEDAILAWKENRLYFDETPMKEAAKMIAAHYGVKITIADDSVGRKPVNGMVPNNNLDVLLKALEATNDFKITRNENEIVVSNP